MEEMNIKKRKRLMKEMSYNDDEVEVSRTTRDVPPAHYLFKIESFSLLSGSYIEKYESGVFEAGGYKWRLLLYPKGNSKDNGNDHISLYLAIADTKSLPRGWEVYINFKLFVYDQIRDKYLTVQDADGKVRRFHGLKTERGFGQLLSLNTFNDASNGYLSHDSCIFGAEVFAIKYNGNGECLSMTQMHQDNTYTWKIDDFSSIDAEFIRSKEFTVGENKWKLSLYLKGDSLEEGEGRSLSLCLLLADSETLPPERKVFADFILCIRDQVHGNHLKLKGAHWFCVPENQYGFPSFMTLSDLDDTSKGFLVNDCVIAEAEIMVTSVVKDFSQGM